jgi:hypothetical protein
MCSLPFGVRWYIQSGKKCPNEKNLSTTISEILAVKAHRESNIMAK